MPTFTPRYTQPDPSDPYYSTYDRFRWLDEPPYGGNCTGYAYGRFNECAGQSLYNDFYITASPGNASQWTSNTWPDQTYTSGSIDLELGDIIIWGGSGAGHVEVVEAIAADNSTITVSYSLWASTYSSSKTFDTRTISYPTWSSTLGTLSTNSGGTVTYSNPFIGYIHNKYITPTPEPPEPSGTILKALPLLLRRRKRGHIRHV